MTPGIPAQLRALRQQQGMPLKVIAGRLGISPSQLCQLEHGRSRIAEQLQRWANALGADVVLDTKASHRKRTAA
jgi:transcriptional regulator with XRE-family HTH domain